MDRCATFMTNEPTDAATGDPTDRNPTGGDPSDRNPTDGAPVDGTGAGGQEAGDAMVRRAAQRYGFTGAMLAGGMVAFDRLLGRREQEDPPVIAEAPDEPVDIDRDGIVLRMDDSTTVVARAPDAATGPTRRIRRRRRSR
ncbi:MAG: hypothetical protein EBU70_07575 [Actinobacteria bacterium]|nr:hypothetical protein [Actinomycetota bacterium]